MKKVLGAFLISAITSPAFAAENNWSGHFSLYAGEKSFDKEDWKGSSQEQDSGGFLIDFKKKNWPVSIAIDLVGTEHKVNNQGKSTTSSIGELDLGIRKVWSSSSLPIAPYIGGGIALSGIERDIYSGGSHTLHEKSALGTWAGVGAYWNITRFFTLGIDMRYTQAEVKLSGKDVNIGGVNTGLTAGVKW